ncbi:MAG: hypothetical protein H0X45_12690 [Planctomycetes bacterium]|nr:hypothetical protein [Planctomycetota bacterium]
MRTVLLILVAAALNAATAPATIDLRVENAPLATLIERIARQCDAGLVVDRSAIAILEQVITLRADDAPWDKAIELIASEYGVAISLDGQRLRVTHADEEFRRRLELRFYDVRSLTAGITAFPGPELDLPYPGEEGSRLLPPVEDTAAPAIAEFAEVLRAHVMPRTWERAGVSLAEFGGSLAIITVPEAHAAIADMLARFEATAARQLVCRIYDLGADAAVPGPVVDAAAWKAMQADAGVPIGVTLMRDQQQNCHAAILQRSFFADVDTVQSRDDPIASIASHGLVVDAHPSVTIGGVLAIIRFSATIEHAETATTFSDAAGQAMVAIETPSNRVASVRDTRLIPLGGAALYRAGDRTIAVEFEVIDQAIDQR